MKVIRNVILATLLLSIFSGCGKDSGHSEKMIEGVGSLVVMLNERSGAGFIATDQERVVVGDVINVYRFPETTDGSGTLKDVMQRTITASEDGDKQLVFEGLEVGIYYTYYFVINIAGNATSSLGAGNLSSAITEKEFRNLRTDELTSASAPLGAPLLMSGKTVSAMGDIGRTKVSLDRAVARFDIENQLSDVEILRVLVSSGRSKGFIFKDHDGEQAISERYSMEIPVTLVVEGGVGVAKSAFYLYPTTLETDTGIAIEVKHKNSGDTTFLYPTKSTNLDVKINSRYSFSIDNTVVIVP